MGDPVGNLHSQGDILVHERVEAFRERSSKSGDPLSLFLAVPPDVAV
jgi:hypothetical protein